MGSWLGQVQLLESPHQAAYLGSVAIVDIHMRSRVPKGKVAEVAQDLELVLCQRLCREHIDGTGSGVGCQGRKDGQVVAQGLAACSGSADHHMPALSHCIDGLNLEVAGA